MMSSTNKLSAPQPYKVRIVDFCRYLLKTHKKTYRKSEHDNFIQL